MNRLDNLYQKAFCDAKNARSQELLKQSSIYMPFWSNAMSYCYAHEITIPPDDNALADVYRTALQACGYQQEEIQHFIEWYFDEDNNAVFVTIDYGNGDLVFGYPPVNTSTPDEPPKEKGAKS
ncbi:MAG: hypothetical protein LUE14_09550 [Clostridiales bacterium]|nr:hypothetical protein [Clostridiales bacterium]